MGVLEQFSLAGKVALVTGASRGLGAGLALAMAEAGADVAIVSRGGLADVQKRIEALGRRCAAVEADLAERAAVKSVMDATVEQLGRVDILINNAGIIRRAAVTDFMEKDWDDVIQVNQDAVFFLSQAAARVMIKQNEAARDGGMLGGPSDRASANEHPRAPLSMAHGASAGRRCHGGRIINIASLLSFQGGIRVGAYTAAKHAVAGITKIMANELASHAITVNAIAPGYMATDNTAPLRADEKRNAEILARIPAGRWGTADDLKGAAVFLASDAAAYVTGTTLAVDGGWLAR